MWWKTPPRDVAVSLFARLPAALATPRRSAWADVNRAGMEIGSFLEGPCFDAVGGFFVTDIPHGRVFRLEGPTHWHLLTEYDGWPNGLALSTSGDLLVADYRHGLLRLDPATGSMAPLLETALTEGFRGLNDVIVDAQGAALFTDQGQTGLTDPTGRVFRLHADGRLDRLLSNGPSPNGLVLNKAGTHLYVAMTRACEVWRLPLRADAMVVKANCFARIPAGSSGPDGMAVDVHDRLFVCNPGHGMVWGFDAHGVMVLAMDCTAFGRHPTNCCFAPDGRTLLITESGTGAVLAAEIPAP